MPRESLSPSLRESGFNFTILAISSNISIIQSIADKISVSGFQGLLQSLFLLPPFSIFTSFSIISTYPIPTLFQSFNLQFSTSHNLILKPQKKGAKKVSCREIACNNPNEGGIFFLPFFTSLRMRMRPHNIQNPKVLTCK